MSRGLPDSRVGAPPYVPDIDTIATHQVFLVERYLPGATLEDVRESVQRLSDATRGSRSVRHVSSTLLPEEGAVFVLFLAESVEAVLAVNALAGQQVDRLVEGIHLRAVADTSPNRGTSPIPGGRGRP
jgi:hypothetical protein